MLSKEKILDLVSRNEIKITYTFLPSEEAEGYVHVQPKSTASNDEQVDNYLKEMIIRNRITLSLGPLIKIRNFGKVKKNQRYKSHKEIVDLRECPDGFELKPGQCVHVYTNERIKFSQNVAGLILSRVGNYALGVTAVASYVDSTWDGILQLVVTNKSNKTAILNLGQRIASLFVFDSECEDSSSSFLAEGSPHYGYNWQEIFSSSRNPFGESANIDDGILGLIQANTKKIISFVGIGMLVFFLFECVKFYNALSEVNKIQKKQVEIEKRVSVIENDRIIYGTTAVSIDANKKSKVEVIRIKNWPKQRGSDAIVLNDMPLVARSKFKSIEPNVSVANGEATLKIAFKLKQPLSEDYVFELEWAIVP